MVWRLITEDVFVDMKRRLEDFPNIVETETRVAAFLGGRCASPHVVDVPVLAGIQTISSPDDLDAMLWLPNVPYLIPNVTDLRSCRLCFEHDNDDSSEICQYHLIYYDQDVLRGLNNAATTTNRLVGMMVDTERVWHGEILIVKTLTSGRVLNFTREDLGILPELLLELFEED